MPNLRNILSRTPSSQVKVWTGLLLIATITALCTHAAVPPEYKIIPAADPAALTSANGWPAPGELRTWTRSLGGATSNRYSELDQINRETVKRLKMAWAYHSGDGTGNIQSNPVVVGSVLYAPTAGRAIVALDAATGKERWRFQPQLAGKGLQDLPARRGLLYWPGAEGAPARLIITAGNWIYALDPLTGNVLNTFGVNGRTELPTGAGATGAVYQGILVVPGFQGDVFGYDVGSGRLLWRFRTIAQPGEENAETWQGRETGANCWGGMSLDESRGIAFIATGSPKPNFIGTGHLGDNLYSDCLIAIDVKTGKRLWHFQEIRHDIWDLDLPAPPNLVTITRAGKKYDAVAQVTKIGNVLLLDRVTGQPLFPFRLRRAPTTTLEGETTAEYQPDPILPEPFARQAFSRDDITERTPEARAFVEASLARANMGWFAPFEVAKPTVYYGLHGGAEWTGAAVDPRTSYLYVSANHLPWAITVFRDDDPEPIKPATAGEQAYQAYCSSCHGPDRKGTGMVPPLRGLRHRMSEDAVLALIEKGRNAMPSMAAVPVEARRAVADFLLVRDRAIPAATAKDAPKYAFGGYRKLLDQEEYPGIKPPWGTLNCIDLNTGKIAWRVPLGEYEALTRMGVPPTGTENFGGAMVTAGGLVFCSGTRDSKIRAFDAATGRELWSERLPWNGTAPPATYEVDGRQYIVIAATGGGKLGGPTGDAWIAFTLPPASTR